MLCVFCCVRFLSSVCVCVVAHARRHFGSSGGDRKRESWFLCVSSCAFRFRVLCLRLISVLFIALYIIRVLGLVDKKLRPLQGRPSHPKTPQKKPKRRSDSMDDHRIQTPEKRTKRRGDPMGDQRIQRSCRSQGGGPRKECAGPSDGHRLPPLRRQDYSEDGRPTTPVAVAYAGPHASDPRSWQRRY